MNGHALAALISAIGISTIWGFVYFRAPRNSTRTLYLMFNFSCLMLIITSYIMWGINNKPLTIIANRISYLFAVFFPPLFIHLIYTLIDSKIKKPLLMFSYSMAIVFLVFSPTKLFIVDFTPYKNLYFVPVLGPVYAFFIGYIYLILAIAYIDLFIKAIRLQGTERLHLFYFAFGTAIGFFGLTTFFMLMYRIDVFWAYIPHDLFIIVYIAIISYAIVRHQLLGIEVIIKRTLVFAGLLASVFAILILPTLLVQEYLFRNAGIGGRFIGLAISGIIIILTMHRIEIFLVNITDKYLFQKKYDYKELLRTFTSKVLTVLQLDKLIDLTRSNLKEIVKLDSCDVKIFDDNSKPDYSILSMAKPKGYILRSDYHNIKEEVVIPLSIHDRAIGLLSLGKKKSDEEYTQDDMDILLPLSRTLAIAISNAKLFDELGKTQAEIAQNEKMATIGTLAAGMAHEIRNPLTTIRTFADYLPERYGDKAFMDNFNKLVPKEIDRVENIARSLLEFSYTGDDAETEEFNVSDVIRTILSLLEPKYRFSFKEICCDLNSVAVLRANKGHIQDALFNVIKYVFSETSKDGRIFITAGCKDQAVDISIRSENLILADGIIKDIFEPASRMPRTKRGFAFDVFVAKQLLEKNGGILSIISSQKGGTEFTITFKPVSPQLS